MEKRKHIIREKKLMLLDAIVDETIADGSRRLIVGQQQVMGDLFLPDYPVAIEKALTAYPKARWTKVITNLTRLKKSSACHYATYTTAERNEYETCFNMSGELYKIMKVIPAAGNYMTDNAYDDWHGYRVERRKVLNKFIADGLKRNCPRKL